MWLNDEVRPASFKTLMLDWVLWFPSALRNAGPLDLPRPQIGGETFTCLEGKSSFQLQSENLSCFSTIDQENHCLNGGLKKWVNALLGSLKGGGLHQCSEQAVHRVTWLAHAAWCLCLLRLQWNSEVVPFDSLISFPEFSGLINHFASSPLSCTWCFC